MTDHLPECAYVVFDQQGQIPATVIPGGCICRELRACEQRVRGEHQADLDHVSYVLGQTNERQRSVLLIADGYAAGVEAALDALSKHRDSNYLPGSAEWMHVDWAMGQVQRLTDNLKEK